MVEASLEAYPSQTEGVDSSLYVRNEWELQEILQDFDAKIVRKCQKICCIVNVLCISGGKFL